MPNGFRCPNCEYVLVLLEGRRKFKCAKCGKLFPQKLVEDEHFKKWNKKQREIERHNQQVEKNLKEQEKLDKKELKKAKNLQKSLNLLFNGLKLSTPEEKRERRLQLKREWAVNNPEKVKEMNRKWLSKVRDKRYDYINNWKRLNLDKSRMNQRLAYWRQQQSKLALEQFKTENPEVHFPLMVFRNYW